jgi:hypothetical protein
MKIIHARVPKLEETLIHQIAIFMQNLRKEDLLKRPGVSETLDWAEALLKLHRRVLDEETVEQTLGCILKYREDIQNFKSNIWPNPEKRTQLLTSYAK